MFALLEILYVCLLFGLYSHKNKGYLVLCIMQTISLGFAPLVDNTITFNTTLTYFNVIYSFIILFLIVTPWNFADYNDICIKNKKFFNQFRKILYLVLQITIINNLIVLVIVLIFMPSVKEFKASQGYLQLYDQIPYFGILFRYTSVTRYLGLFAIVFFIYYLNQGKWKEARKALLMSMSTLIAACAFYSRAQIVVYLLILVCMYLLSYKTIHNRLKLKINKIMKRVAIIVVVGFMTITVVRFSEMTYYADRIPNTSYIKEPITYSIVDYASKGFSNGINQLEVHEISDIMWGEQSAQSLLMVLSYFHIINWDVETFIERTDKAYTKPQKLGDDNDSGSFHGFTCRMVKDCGYFFTFLICLLYYNYVRKKLHNKLQINFSCLIVLTFLMSLAINSIFYSGIDVLLFPFLFYLFVRVLTKFTFLIR